MWNPHIGNNLHKRGSLPYMNAQKEHECDVKAIKALLYGFQKGYILYKSGIGDKNNNCFFSLNNKKIKDSDGRWINSKNIASLVSWIRNEDDLIEEWSAAFDESINRQKSKLTMVSSDGDQELANLKTSITNSEFISLLNKKLYTNPETGRDVSALEFAYMVKNSEELGRDCDDAERIIDVLYRTFRSIIEHRANPESNQERFIQMYKHEIQVAFDHIVATSVVQGDDKSEDADVLVRAKAFEQWLTGNRTFFTIADDAAIDEKGNVCINAHFDFAKIVVKKLR
jgi:hypothetical protein